MAALPGHGAKEGSEGEEGAVGCNGSWAEKARGRLIVVEEDFRSEPAREVDGRLVAALDGAVGCDG